MKVLVTGGAGFIGSNFARHLLAEHPGRQRRRARQAHLRGPGRDDPGPDRRRAAGVRAGRHRRPRRRARRARGLRRDRQLRGRVARRPLDRGAGPLHPDRRVRHLRAARGVRAGPASSATSRSRPTRSTARSRRARSPSRARSTPPPPTRPRRPAATCWWRAYCHTYGIDAVVCRASNNYGPYQYPEKLIPLCVLNALHGDPLPVYGDGMQVRNWLHVTDHCRGARRWCCATGKAGEVYNIGGPDELPEHRRRAQDPAS